MNPNGRSPASVWDDPNYEFVADDGGAPYVERVVRHKATGSLWACRFAIRIDDSDRDCPTTWWAVEEKTETRTVYRRIESAYENNC